MKKSYDFVIAGAGIVGLSIARALRTHAPASSILMLQKQTSLGEHSSGNNSGVLHAGIYYRKDSLRAKYCYRGNQALREFHLAHNIPLRDTGKIIAPCTEEENQQIPVLFQRAQEGNAEVEIIDAKLAKQKEPRLKVQDHFQYIWSPKTAVGSPRKVLDALVVDLKDKSTSQNFELRMNSRVETIQNNQIKLEGTDGATIHCGFFINSAGLYSLTLAQQVLPHLAKRFKMVPLRGQFLISENKIEDLGQPVIYPVPPGKKNFVLGVHTIITPDLHLKVGPSARPNFESFEGRSGNINYVEAFQTMHGLLSLEYSMIKDGVAHLINSRTTTDEEGKTHSTPMEAKLATIYDAEGIKFAKYPSFGVRPQLVDLQAKKLHDDMVVEKTPDGKQIHLLNVISPGWTSSLPLGEDLVKEQILGSSGDMSRFKEQ